MSLRRFIIKLRVMVTTLVVLSAVCLFGGLSYIHEQGFNEEATARVSKEMERYGIFAEFDNLSFHLIRGLTANNVRFYQCEKREVQIAELPALALHVDKTKLMRGKLKINTVTITDANLAIPLNKEIEESPLIHISNVNGSVDLSGNQSLSTSNLVGEFEGIQVALNCNIWRDEKAERKKLVDIDPQKQIDRYNHFLSHLKSWHWPTTAPPKLKFIVEGNLSNPGGIEFNIELSADSLEFKNYEFDDVYLEGDLNQNLLTIDTLEFKNQGDELSAVADYDLINRNGRFRVDSAINPKTFALQLFGKHILKSFSAAGGIRLIGDGQFQLPNTADEKLDFTMIGSAAAQDFSFRGCSLHTLTSDFSWNNGDLYLDKLRAEHDLGELQGRLIIKDRLIKYSTTASLPAEVYFPFIKNQKLKESLAQLKFTNRSTIDVLAKGSINQDNPREWNAYGNATLKNFSYRGVAAKSLLTDYTMNSSSSTFSNLKGTFDYTNYALRQKHGGPQTGSFSAKELDFDWKKRTVNITKLRGNIWPAPVLRMFATSVADHLENYRFHLPPTVSAGGLICWSSESNNNTRFRVGFTSTGTTTYRFLDEDVNLSRIKGQVTVLPNKVQVNSLSGSAFGGPISGYLHVTPSSSAYSGRFQWDRLKLKAISKTYGFDDLDSGTLTGSFKFRGKGNKITTLNGHGNLALSNGDLFSVPLFGPLSSLINGVLTPISRQKILHDQAKDFACNFSTKNGTFYTKDLTSATPNTTFTGEGWINPDKQTLDLTIRMNFRGLMGLAEVPMKVIELPFQALRSVFTGKQVKGLRQFRGTGKISNPKWRFTPFEAPRNAKNDPIFRKPPKARVVR